MRHHTLERKTPEAQREIPASIKRRVRKDCYFGCIFCGLPVFEYEHIDDWALVKKHLAENIALLCPTHHSAKSTGKIGRERVRLQRSSPFNKGRHTTSGYRVEGDRRFAVKFGDMHAAGDLSADGSPYHILYVNGTSMVSVRDVGGWISPSFTVTDRAGRILLSVEDGEIRVSTVVWDYTYIGSRITIRGALRNIMLELDFSSEFIHIIRGQFFDCCGDGFDVAYGRTDAYMDGDIKAHLQGDGTVGWGVGALAIVNKKRYPNFNGKLGFAILF